MTHRIQQLRERRANLVHQAREIVDAAEAEDRDLTTEEETRYDALLNDANGLKSRIDREERQLELDGDLNRRAYDPLHHQDDGGEGDDGDDDEIEQRQMSGFNKILRNQTRSLTADEQRALQADFDEQGGFLYAPMQFRNELIQRVDDMTYLRQWGRVITLEGADGIGVPTLETDPSDPEWTSELGEPSLDTALNFGNRQLHPHPLRKEIKESLTLLRRAPQADDIVRDRLAYKFNIAMESNFMTGDGQNKPLGVFTASADGISTARDVSTGNTTTAMTFDGLIEAKYALKPQYWRNARWLFHRNGQKQLAKAKDNEGQYLWRESVRAGEPDRVLNLPAFMSEFVPNTFTSGKYVGMLADFSHFWIVDALQLQMTVLSELYRRQNQIGIIGELESDGMPVLEEAFVRIQLA